MAHLQTRSSAASRSNKLAFRFALALVLMAAIDARISLSIEVDRAARVSTFAPPSSVTALPTDLRTADGMPRAAFVQDEIVALGVRSPTDAELFALLIDSHGVVSLLGALQDGWLGRVAAKSDTTLKIVNAPQWTNGLPLGDSSVLVYAFSRLGAAELKAGLVRVAAEDGIVDHSSIAPLSELLASLAMTAPTMVGASHIDLSLVHAKAPRSRGLAVNRAPPTPPMPLTKIVHREEIVRHFTGPRSRGIRRLRLDVYIQFAFNAKELASARNPQLEEMAAALRDPRLGSLDFQVGGHTDRVGSREYNLDLSKARAEFVRQLLVDEHGIQAKRLVAQGFAFDRALDRSSTPDADATNRRVDFQLLRD